MEARSRRAGFDVLVGEVAGRVGGEGLAGGDFGADAAAAYCDAW